MISEQSFLSDIENLQQLTNSYCVDNRWHVKTIPSKGSYAECESKFVEIDEGVFARRMANVCYNNVYQVPVLWFNFYDLDGNLLQLAQFEAFICARLTDIHGTNLLEGISQNEHPFLGVAFYNLHPCKISELMRPLTPKNYVLSFLTIIGPFIGLTSWPIEMMVDPNQKEHSTEA